MRRVLRFCTIATLLVTLGAAAVFAAADENKFDSLKRFSQVLDLVERHYVSEPKRKELLNGAIKGMLQGLDPHSNYMNPEEYKDMQETTTGEFSGIGIEISLENGQVTVVSPIEDTPAFRAGLQSGDIILAINGQPTQELSLQEVVSRIRGTKGTDVELSILHSDAKTPLTVNIVRDAIPLISVKSKELEEGYYWMRITRFSERTTQELQEALKDAAKTGLKGIVLDLRNNPGGLVEQAVAVSDTFLPTGTIVSIRGRQDSSKREYTAKAQGTDVTVPMVVLVNAGSASASEIVAGALRDHKRALIIGERTFGKGSVQNIIPLSDGSGLKLTVALYYTPNGSSIQAEGIAPDIEIPFEPVRSDEKKPMTRQMVREKDLTRHLSSTNSTSPESKKSALPSTSKEKIGDKAVEKNGEKAGSKKGKTTAKPNEVKEQLERDNQLRMGLQFVKSLPKFREIKGGAA